MRKSTDGPYGIPGCRRRERSVRQRFAEAIFRIDAAGDANRERLTKNWSKKNEKHRLVHARLPRLSSQHEIDAAED
jgi:hypothetical protein